MKYSQLACSLFLATIGFSALVTALNAGVQEKSDDAKVQFSDEDVRFFVERVQPILKKNCLECHGDNPDELGGGLALISRKTILSGGDSGSAVDLEHLSDSILLDAINYGSYEMPPDGKLKKEEIDTITEWVRKGMPWPAGDAEKEVERKSHTVPEVNAETKAFWSFQPVTVGDPPQVKQLDWCHNEIDRYILSSLETAGLKPSPTAARADLIRRAYYDLIGLPPTREQVDAFVNDTRADAWPRLIDELLASPHYGEKWARHWLDVVRYAESNSFERDGTKPFIWRYRDYVIRSFNDDKPYDQFLIEQLAGDELENPSNDAIIATGYYRLGQWDDEPADPKQALYDDLDDILATTTQSMIGLTVNCARCHDHKIDPIPQTDYYQMLAFFRNVRRYGERSHESVERASTTTVEKQVPPSAEEVQEYETKLADALRRKQEIVDLVKGDFEPVEHEEFQYERNHERLVHKRIQKGVITQKQFDQFWHGHHDAMRLRDNPPTSERVLCVTESGAKVPETKLLIRGNPHVEGDTVEPQFVSVLSPPQPEIAPPVHGKSSGRRLALAKWITSEQHPLTARVMVNRLWQYHFGRGIVRSSNDFGFQGDRPTHPQLLDYLAQRLMDGDWKLKDLHREIMLSNTYQMSNQFNEQAYAQDPLNHLFWRFDMRRLTAEELRDSMLAVNGRLNRESMYGPSVFTKLSDEVLAGQSIPGDGWGNSSPEDQLRRSIYIHVKRSLRVPILSNFDAADTDATCPVRFNTTQPTQALGLLNGQFSNSEAAEFAKMIAAERAELRDQISGVLERVTQNSPRTEDVEEGVRLVENWRTSGLSNEQSLQFYCLLAFNLNEFVFVR